MKTLLLDMDGILTEFNRYTLEKYNAVYSTTYDLDYADYLLGDSKPVEGITAPRVVELFKLPDYFLNMPAKDGAIKAVHLLEKFFDVQIVTKVFPGVTTGTYHEKEQWVSKYTPSLVGKMHFVTGSKVQVCGDILVDDAFKNQNEWGRSWRPKGGMVASLKYPWTDPEYVDVIAASWLDLSKILVLNAGDTLV